jgi:hypothetical protein
MFFISYVTLPLGWKERIDSGSRAQKDDVQTNKYNDDNAENKKYNDDNAENKKYNDDSAENNKWLINSIQEILRDSLDEILYSKADTSQKFNEAYTSTLMHRRNNALAVAGFLVTLLLTSTFFTQDPTKKFLLPAFIIILSIGIGMFLLLNRSIKKVVRKTWFNRVGMDEHDSSCIFH